MYLGMLNKKQKSLFLEFVYNLAIIDGEYSQEEKQMIKAIVMK